MNPNSPGSLEKIDLPRAAGCCAGQAAGCGCSFLGGWILSLILSALINALLGPSQGGNLLVSALAFFASLLAAGIISFLVGRWLPAFKKKAG
jgi:hypothetical protein